MQGIITDENSRIAESGSPKAGAQSQVRAINEALAERLGTQKYRIWFKNSTKFSVADGYLRIGVPNLFIASWIENHFLNEVNQAVREATGTKLKVTFTIDPELSGNLRRTQLDSPCTNWPEEKTPGRTRRPAPESVSIGAGKLTLDTFVVGPSNELAYNAAKAVVREKHCPFNPLFVHGGYGLGKTHLLQGICNELAKRRPETKWLYMSAEDFTNQFVLALKLKKLETFRRRIRQTDLLAIDDIHFLANKPSTQEEFLHTFNTINLAGKQVVLVSDAHPKMIGQLSEKLVSRFVSGMVVKIESPDFQTRCQICRQFVKNSRFDLPRQAKFSAAGRTFPESVIRYIAENLRTNVRELEGALLKVIAYSALQNEKITLSLAQSVLADHLERCDPIVHISDIESAVASYFGITPANIHSAKKDRTVALARHFSMYLTRKHTKMSSSEIGRFMGNKNHATVLLACKKVEQLINQNADIHWKLDPRSSILDSRNRSSSKNAVSRIEKARTVLDHLEQSISG